MLVIITSVNSQGQQLFNKFHIKPQLRWDPLSIDILNVYIISQVCYVKRIKPRVSLGLGFVKVQHAYTWNL